MWLKLQRHVSSLSRGCSFSLILALLNASPEGHFDGLGERKKKKKSLLGTFLEQLWPLWIGAKLTAGSITVIKHFVWSRNHKNTASRSNSIKEGSGLAVHVFILSNSHDLKATAVCCYHSCYHTALFINPMNKVKSTSHQRSLIKSALCILESLYITAPSHTTSNCECIVRWINSEFPA